MAPKISRNSECGPRQSAFPKKNNMGMKTKRKKTRNIIDSGWTHGDSGNFEISKWLSSKHLDTRVWTQNRDWA